MEIKDDKTVDTILIGYDYSHINDHAVLTVCRRGIDKSLTIINEFSDNEAKELYERLVTRVEKEEGDQNA